MCSGRKYLLNPSINHGCNFQIIQFQVREMAITMDSNVPQLDPLRSTSRLLKIRHDTVVVCDMRARVSGQRHERNAGNVRQGMDEGSGLQYATAVARGVHAYGGEVQFGIVTDGRIVSV